METRIDLINYLIEKKGYKSYLEIGCQHNSTFNRINIDKVGVDPQHGGTLRMTSDEFFNVNVQIFDIIFIDGLHISTQVEKDIKNSLKVLSKNGVIVVHDCNPSTKEAQEIKICKGAWNGDVWKGFVKFRSYDNLDIHTVNLDFGCGIIFKRINTDILIINDELNWEGLKRNRDKWLRLVNIDKIDSLL